MEPKEEQINEESDNDIQATKEEKKIKEKKPHIMTEKRKIAWEQILLKRKANNDLRKQIKEAEEKQITKLIEEKVIKKAISLKKREIKQNKILDEISDDDTPLEEINKIIKAPPIRRPNKSKLFPKTENEIKQIKPNTPKYIFM